MNKKLFLCSLLVLFGNSLLSASDQAKNQDAITDTTKKRLAYSELKENFKVRLSKKYQSCLSQAKYYEFIEPYLQKAENELEIIRYLINAQEHNEELVIQYFDILFILIISHYLHKKIGGYSMALLVYKVYCNNLKIILNEFKKEAALENLDIEDEFEETIHLFEKANNALIRSETLSSK